MANEKRLVWTTDVMSFLCRRCNEMYPEDPCEPSDCLMAEELEKCKTVDAVPVVHGRWEDFCRGKMCCCSICKAEFDNTCNEIHGEWYYCPNCGAKMDGDGNG